MATSVFTIEIFVTLLTFILFGSENQFDISIMSLLIEVLEGGGLLYQRCTAVRPFFDLNI